MSYGDLYQHMFDELLSLIRRDTESERKNMDESQDEGEYVVDLSSDTHREYQRIIARNEGYIILELERAIRWMLTDKGVVFCVPVYYSTDSHSKFKKLKPFTFTMKNEDKTTAYSFCFKQTKGVRQIREQLIGCNGVDELRMYFLLRNHNEEIDLLNKLGQNGVGKSIRFGILKDFLKSSLAPKNTQFSLNMPPSLMKKSGI